jgi:hypothetical protein
MPCVAPPPPQVAAIIEVGSGPNDPVTFRAADPASANYLANANGDWDFSCFKGPIRVQLTIHTSGFAFYTGGGRDAISFAERPDLAKQPPPPKHHQFPDGVRHVTAQTISFRYSNHWDCGAGDGQRRCPDSAYGVYVGDAGGRFVRHADPIIHNGGS